MALQLNDLLMRLSPTQHHPMTDGEDKSLERQRLALMKQEFEEAKRKNAEEAELRRISEAGEMTRAKMLDERQRAQQEAQAQAETLKQRRTAHDDMLKYRDVGDYEGMEGAANRLNELGGLAERLGEDEHGLPTWHVELDAEKYKKEQAALEQQQAPGEVDNPENPYSTHPGDESLTSSLSRLSALGYPGTDRGTLMPPAGISSSDDLTAEQMARVTGGGSQQRAATDRAVAQPPLEVEPEPGPPEAVPDNSPIKPEYRQAPQGLDPLAALRPARLGPVPAAPADIMGGVPKNVIDTGAMNAQAQRRLGPVMANIEASMPAAYRDSTRASNQAAQDMALPADKTLEASLKLRAPADAATAREREHEFKTEEQATEAERKAMAEEKDPIKRQRRVKSGQDYAKTAFVQGKIQERSDVLEAAVDIERLLNDGIAENDDLVVNKLMKLDGQVGSQTEPDAARVTGEQKASFATRVKGFIKTLTEGGYDEPFKKSMLEFAHALQERNRGKVHDYISEMSKQANASDDPLVGKGYRDFVSGAMPAALEAYNKENPPEVEGGEAPGATPVSAAVDDDEGGGDFDTALDSAADDHGLDADKMRTIIGPESAGKGDAKNKGSSASGIIQMIDSTARRYDNPRTGKKFANAAELRELSPAEQAPIAAQYFHDAGVTADSPPEDYALAVAAPAFVGKSADRDAVVYRKGSDEYEANKPWWPKDGGDITVGSILDFYIKKKKGDAEAPASSKPAAGGQDAARKKLLEGL